jgi:predicted metal-binding membrane protein
LLTIFRRERVIVSACLVALVLLAWLYLLHMNATMVMSGMNMPGMSMVNTQPWDATAVLLLFVMWTVMMVAMMAPSAAPMILTFLTVNQNRSAAQRRLMPTGIFLLGYLTVWTAYSAVATLAEWGLHRAALLSTTMSATSAALNGALLILAGLFQLTPIKRACLQGCRSPLSFLMSEWREGAAGVFIMGLRHGAYCVGCCWILMALLFVTGVMNLFWVAALALLVMAEKILPKGEIFASIAGIGLLVAGIVRIAEVWR